MSTSSPPPSSRGPAGAPPPSGNGKYLAVAIVLLLGMVGLIAFKFSGSSGDEKPKLPLVPSATTTPTESKIDEVPPPPPVETAAPDTGAPKVAARAGFGDPCAVRSCAGSMTPELESAMAVRAKQARRCYENELKNDPSLKGKIAMTVRVAINGTVCGATITNSELPAISSCVERVFRSSGGLPSPKGGCVDANVPMSFIPGR